MTVFLLLQLLLLMVADITALLLILHVVNTKVTIAPTFPKATVKKAINDTINAVFPQLFAVGRHEFNYNPAISAYEIPAEVETILYVSRSVSGSSKEWLPVRNWRHDPLANNTAFTTANTVSIYDAVEAGRKVQDILYKEAYNIRSICI
jgi:hypothetical protein